MEDITLEENEHIRNLRRAIAAEDPDWIAREYAECEQHNRLRVHADRILQGDKPSAGKKGGLADESADDLPQFGQ